MKQKWAPSYFNTENKNKEDRGKAKKGIDDLTIH